MILLPTTCWMMGVSGWKLNHSVTLIASLPTAGVMVLQPGPGAGSNAESAARPVGCAVAGRVLWHP